MRAPSRRQILRPLTRETKCTIWDSTSWIAYLESEIYISGSNADGILAGSGQHETLGGAVNSGGCGGVKRHRAGPVTGFVDNNPHTFIHDDFFAFATALKDGDPRGLVADEITQMLSLIPTLDVIT